MARDSELIQIIDGAMAEAARLSGAWLVCRPGCAECCLGAFPITALDAARLRSGLAELHAVDPERAKRVVERARVFREGDDEPCPALDPETKMCDVYAARPVTCRVFGPAIRAGGDIVGICELNYAGATDEEIAACQVELDTEALEEELLAGDTSETTVAEALLRGE